jgi:hypothetical protein
MVSVGGDALTIKINKGCVTHSSLSISIKKYLKEKEELWKLKYFTIQSIIFLKFSKRKPK